jgi:hypothetical protein
MKSLKKLLTPYVLALLTGGVVAAALVAAADVLPLATAERAVVVIRKTPGIVVLNTGTVIKQRFVALPGTYSSVVLYSDAEQLTDQQLQVRILDEDGAEVATGRGATAAYLDDDTIRIGIPISWLYVANSQHLFLEVSLGAGSSLPVLISSSQSDTYASGELVVDGQALDRDVAFALLERAQLPFGARQGVLAGAIILLALVIMQPFINRPRGWWLATGVLVIITPLVLAGYWFSAGELGIADWDYYFPLHHSYRQALLKHHTFPLWNPYTCGGTAGLADPEFPGFTPTFLLELIFGIPVGLRLAIFLSTAVGAAGMLALSRRLGLSVLAGVLAAIVVAFSSVNLLEITEGHVNILAAMWIPWIFWSWLGVYRGRTRPIVCGIFLALTFLQGGVYLLMYTALALVGLILLVRHPGRAIIATLRSGLWGLGLAAFKLVPVLFWLKQFPDEAYASSAYTVPWLVDILFGRHLHGSYIIHRQESGWHEYGAYVGYGVLALALLGLSCLKKNRVVQGLLVAVVLTAVLSAAGPALKPIFDYLWFFPRSNISRVILFTVISLAVLAGFGLDQLRGRLKRWSLVAAVVIGVIAADIFSLAYQVSQQAFVLPRVYPLVEPAPWPIAFTPGRYDMAGQGSRTTRTYDAALAGYGTLAYCSVLGPEPRVQTIYDPNYDIIELSASEGGFELLEWSPNEVHVRVKTSEQTQVKLNTNYAKGWMVNGLAAQEIEGRVATTVGLGIHDLVFEYHAPGVWLGLGVTLATLAGVIGLRKRN